KSDDTILDWQRGRAYVMRLDDNWDWQLQPEDIFPIKSHTARTIERGVEIPYVRIRDDLEELVEPIRNNLYSTMRAGQVEELMSAMPGAVFVPQILGTKKPLIPRWPSTNRADTQNEFYLRRLAKTNIALLC